MTRHPFLPRFILATLVSVCVASALILAFLSRANELSILSLADIRAGKDLLWGSAFDQSARFKLARIESMKPDLLIAGSSRATQFRAEMFKGASSYNASLAVTSLPDAEAFFAHVLSVYTPKLVLLTVDPWWFNPERGLSREEKLTDYESSQRWRHLFANAMKEAAKPETLKMLLTGPNWPEADPFGHRKPAGFAAAYRASGFRPDGSFQYGYMFLDLIPYYRSAGYGWQDGFVYYRKQVAESRGRFRYTGRPGDEQIARLRQTLEQLRAKQVRVVVVLPPFSKAVVDEIERTPAQKAFLKEIEDVVRETAAASGAEFHNYHDLSKLGVSDEQTVDAVHADEIATARMTVELLQNSQALKALTDPDAAHLLQDRLADRTGWASPHILFR